MARARNLKPSFFVNEELADSQDIPDSCPDLLDSCMGSACERNDLVPGFDDLDPDR